MKRKSPWSQGRRGFGACMLHELAEVLKAVAQAVRSKVGRQQDPESVLAITMSRRCLEPGAWSQRKHPQWSPRSRMGPG